MAAPSFALAAQPTPASHGASVGHGPVAMRMSLVWHDEVMHDVVCSEPRSLTLGHSGRDTFTIPNLGLPAGFSIVRPGNRGYLLTLGGQMRGTICIDGVEQDVRAFIAQGADGFHATPISGRDWGVIELDDSGTHKVFFQFVPLKDAETVQPMFSNKILLACVGGWMIAGAVLGALFAIRGLDVDESFFRAGLVALIPIVLAALVWYVILLDGEAQASLAFAAILHAYMLYWTYKLFDPLDDPNVFPGSRANTGQYLVTRLEDPPPEPPPPPPTVGAKAAEPAAPKSPEKPNNAATKNDEGAAGGKGEKERARDKNAKEDVVKAAPKVAFFEDKNKKFLDNIINHDSTKGIDAFNGIKGDVTKAGDLGFGPGTGTGAGEGTGTGTTRGSKKTGPGGGGFSDNDIVRNKGPIDTGRNRPGGNCVGANCSGAAAKEIKVAIASPEGDFGGLSAAEIDRVVRSRQGVFRACYQKALDHTPGLGGKLVIHFKIGGDGAVQVANTAGGSSLRNDAVESCINSNVMRLKFPAKGGVANVNYPFVFSQGG